MFNHSKGGFEMVKKWVSLGEFNSFELTNKEKEYKIMMSEIPNFNKRQIKSKKKRKRKKFYK